MLRISTNLAQPEQCKQDGNQPHHQRQNIEEQPENGGDEGTNLSDDLPLAQNIDNIYDGEVNDR